MPGSGVTAEALRGPLERLHALGWRHPAAVAAWAALGCHDEAAEVAARLAPLHPLPPGLAAALFPDVPTALLDHVTARLAAAGTGLASASWAGAEAAWAARVRDGAPVAGADPVDELVEHLEAVLDDIDPMGRPVAAALLATGRPGAPARRWFHAVAVLHEAMDDADHLALAAAGLGRDAAAVKLSPPGQPERFASDHPAPVEAAAARLRARGLLDRHGRPTAALRDLVEECRAHADRLAMAPFAVLGAGRRARVAALLARVVDLLDPAAHGRVGVTRRPVLSAPLPRPSHLVPPDRAVPGAPGLAPSGGARGAVHVTVVLGGVEVDEGPLLAMLDADPGVDLVVVRHPDAEALFHPRAAATTDVFVVADRPGVVMEPGRPPRYPQPRDLYVAGFHRLLEAGKPMVFLHHALGGWPAWAEYAEILGGRFSYSSCTLRGRRWPASGHRHGVRQRLTVVDPTHPVCEGLGDGFDIVDEVFLCPVFTSSITPLLRSDFSFDDHDVVPVTSTLDPTSHDAGWRHPKGSDVVVWAKRYERSPLVYVQPGGTPSTFANPGYRRLVANALRWSVSPAAHAWASGGAGVATPV